MRRSLPPLLALSALLLLAAGASAAKKKEKEPEPPQNAETSALIKEIKATGLDKRRFENYVKRRLSKITDRHKARMDWMAKESEVWNSFWTKIRDERKLFEVRATKQTLALFESLASLDPNDHAGAIAAFEGMQGSMNRSFEAQQQQKLREFFAARDQRWRDFVTEQERERGLFLAEAPADWQQSRAGTAGAAEHSEGELGAEGEEAPKPKGKKKAPAPPPEEG